MPLQKLHVPVLARFWDEPFNRFEVVASYLVCITTSSTSTIIISNFVRLQHPFARTNKPECPQQLQFLHPPGHPLANESFCNDLRLLTAFDKRSDETYRLVLDAQKQHMRPRLFSHSWNGVAGKAFAVGKWLTNRFLTCNTPVGCTALGRIPTVKHSSFHAIFKLYSATWPPIRRSRPSTGAKFWIWSLKADEKDDISVREVSDSLISLLRKHLLI